MSATHLLLTLIGGREEEMVLFCKSVLFTSYFYFREQRITHILIFLLVGLSVFMTPLLRMIPLPVLYGVFLYMGITALNGLQFFDRLCLFLMPTKHQPDYPYLRRVPLKRVHLFTGIQLACMIVLWVVQDIKQTAILFPIMVRSCLDNIFIFFSI